MKPHPPGPRSGLFGLKLARGLRRRPLEFFTELARQYGDLAWFRAGPYRICLVNRPELIRDILVNKQDHYRKLKRFRRVIGQVAGNGLIVSEGDFWRRQRRLVQPAFHAERLRPYAQITVEYTRRMLDEWPDEIVVPMGETMGDLARAIIAKQLFDIELTGKAANMGKAVRLRAEFFMRELGSPLKLPDWLPLPAKRRKRWALRVLDEVICEIIAQRRAAGTDQGDLLSKLLLAVDEEGDGTGMTDQQARDEAMTLFNGGHDTAAAALTWLWYVLAHHPDVKQRLTREIDAVLAGRPATYEDVARLPYTEMVIKETLRMYPPTWCMTRGAVTDVELGGYRIDRGTWLIVSPYVTQHDPRYFEDPDRFDPERFSPDRADKIEPFTYFPFGGGPRVCIAKPMAMMQLALIAATMLQHAELDLAPGQGEVAPEALIAIRPRGGLRMTVRKKARPQRLSA